VRRLAEQHDPPLADQLQHGARGRAAGLDRERGVLEVG
jgi:hypothetical protein